MKVAVFASGSSGNAIWVSSASTALLIDAGISGRRISQAAEGLGLDATELSAVLVTHEHSDHVSGLGPVTRRFDIPAFATAGTHAAIDRRLGKCPGRTIVEAGSDFEIGDLLVSPFAISHDCAEPVGYSVSDGRTIVVVATDLGVVSHPVRHRIGQADCVVLEFNHDEHMLRDGGYTVVTASNGAEALASAERHSGPVDLLITDVVMPDLNGKELADALVAARPGLGTLFISGYASDLLEGAGVAEESIDLLHKPFSRSTLLLRVRAALDRRGAVTA